MDECWHCEWDLLTGVKELYLVDGFGTGNACLHVCDLTTIYIYYIVSVNMQAPSVIGPLVPHLKYELL